MSPPRVLPPGHFVGDGHNHGADSSAQAHGHAHSHESVEEHLHHLQEHQDVRGTATREEFMQAARETAQLTSGQKPEAQSSPSPRNEARQTVREEGQRRPQGSETPKDSGSGTSRSRSETSQATSRDLAGFARLFSAATTAANHGPHTSAWSEAARQAALRTRSDTALPPSFRNSNPDPETAKSGSHGAHDHAFASSNVGGEDHEAQVFTQALNKLQTVLREPTQGGGKLANLPPEAIETITILLQELAVSPELMASLPAELKIILTSLLGQMGTTTPSKLANTGMAGIVQGLLIRGFPISMTLPKPATEASLRSIGLFFGAPVFSPIISSKFQQGFLQRFEKMLLQFIRMFSAKTETQAAKESQVVDKAMLEALAALVAAEEKRRREKEKLRKKDGASIALQYKGNSNLSDGDPRNPSASHELVTKASN